MEDTREPAAAAPPWQIALRWLGAVGLLIAMASDAVAVLGRHAGFSAPGSIEIFQMSLVVALSCAVLLTSFARRHAVVDVVIVRASPRWLGRLHRLSDGALAITFALISAGSALALWDLWHTGEMTDVLAVPVRPFRLVWSAATVLATVHFAIRFVRGSRR